MATIAAPADRFRAQDRDIRGLPTSRCPDSPGARYETSKPWFFWMLLSSPGIAVNDWQTLTLLENGMKADGDGRYDFAPAWNNPSTGPNSFDAAGDVTFLLSSLSPRCDGTRGSAYGFRPKSEHGYVVEW